MSNNSKRKSFIAFMATLIALLPAGFGTVLLLNPPLKTEEVEKEKNDDEKNDDEKNKNNNKQELSSALTPKPKKPRHHCHQRRTTNPRNNQNQSTPKHVRPQPNHQQPSNVA